MVTPVREHTLLDLLIQALLHAVHVLVLVRLEALVLCPITPVDGLLQARALGAIKQTNLAFLVRQRCHVTDTNVNKLIACFELIIGKRDNIELIFVNCREFL